MKKDRNEPIPAKSFSKLVNLFESIDSIEKGIAKVYDYLLKNGMIEDAKSVEKELDISLKRIYKIIAVLKELRLITTYGRPMKVIIKTPAEAWEKIISTKIKQIKLEANKKIERCENAYAEVVEAYNLQQEAEASAPVEFVNIGANDNLYNYISNEMVIDKEMLVAKGLPFNLNLENFHSDDNNGHDFKKIVKLPLTILLSSDYIDDVLNKIKTLQIKSEITKIVDSILPDKSLRSIRFKVVEQPFSNFAVKDKKDLLQYSISPSNKLIGVYISREKEVVEIFTDKFLELFDGGIPLQTYFSKKYNREISTVEKIAFILF